MPITLPVATLIGSAVAGGATAYGVHSSGSSAKRAAGIQATSDAAALEDARQQREEAKRQFDAQQAQQAKEFAAAEEERAYARQKDEYNQRLLQEREQRAAPYRQLSQQAVGRLGDLLGLSRGMPLASPAPMQGNAPMSAPMSDPRFQNVSRGMSMADLLNMRGGA